MNFWVGSWYENIRVGELVNLLWLYLGFVWNSEIVDYMLGCWVMIVVFVRGDDCFVVCVWFLLYEVDYFFDGFGWGVY